jgi:hypothetical protein
MKRLLGLALLALAGVAGSGASPGPEGKATFPAGLRILSDRTLPPVLRAAMEVRWASDSSVLLALGRSGVMEVPLEVEGVPVRTVVEGEKGPKGFWFSSRLGVSSRFLVVGASIRTLLWQKWPASPRQEAVFEFIEDLDVQADRLLVLGARKDAQERFAPDSVIAWIGSLSRDLSDLRPVQVSVAGPGARPMANCGTFEMGAVRFLPDGSFVVIPGVEPGIFLYQPGGTLSRTWDTAAIGLDTDCGSLDDKQHLRLAAQPEPRFAWLNQRRTVDDVLPLPEGAGLLVRSVREGRANWQLVLLGADGAVTRLEISIAGNGPTSHLRGDVRQGRIVLLMYDYGRDGPPAAPRLLVSEMTHRP